MKLNQIVYASKTKKKLEFKDVREMAGKFDASNKLRDITGLLIYGNGYFMQILEGEQFDINELYHKIAIDGRHEGITVLNYAQIALRQFNEWSMGCLLIDSQPEIKEIVEEYFEDNTFNPYNLSPEQANLFLSEVGQYYRRS